MVGQGIHPADINNPDDPYYNYHDLFDMRDSFEDTLPGPGVDLSMYALKYEVLDIYTDETKETPLQKLMTLTPVPIPATVWIFGSALLGLVGIRKRFNTEA